MYTLTQQLHATCSGDTTNRLYMPPVSPSLPALAPPHCAEGANSIKARGQTSPLPKRVSHPQAEYADTQTWKTMFILFSKSG